MKNSARPKLADVLLVEDSLGDIRLTQEAFRAANPLVRLHVATDGIDAMATPRSYFA
jgi:hypothetical protein